MLGIDAFLERYKLSTRPLDESRYSTFLIPSEAKARAEARARARARAEQRSLKMAQSSSSSSSSVAATAPVLPDFCFPRLTDDISTTITTNTTTYSSSTTTTTTSDNSNTPSKQRPTTRQHRRSGAVSSAPSRRAHRLAQFYPPVPPLPSDLSAIPRPSLCRPTPKQRPSFLRLNPRDSQLDPAMPIYQLAASPPQSPAHSQRCSSPRPASDNSTTPSTCPTLLPDHDHDHDHDGPSSPNLSEMARRLSYNYSRPIPRPLRPSSSASSSDASRKLANRKTHFLPSSLDDLSAFDNLHDLREHPAEEQDVPNEDDLDDEDEEEDSDFWECVGSSSTTSDNVADWLRACSESAGPDQEGLESLDGGWVRAA